MTITLTEVGVISTSAVDVISVDMTKALDAGETISSITSVTESTGDITIGSTAVKSATWIHKKGHTVAANLGVQVGVTAPAASGTYTLTWTLATSASRTLTIATKLSVV